MSEPFKCKRKTRTGYHLYINNIVIHLFNYTSDLQVVLCVICSQFEILFNNVINQFYLIFIFMNQILSQSSLSSIQIPESYEACNESELTYTIHYYCIIYTKWLQCKIYSTNPLQTDQKANTSPLLDPKNRNFSPHLNNTIT